ncbi:MAG: hypothetical protein LKI59_02460 [Bacteroidales bacterium]|jgi:hypothetical protein|nr:hypothetical protein [Bacteroidales bacterium]
MEKLYVSPSAKRGVGYPSDYFYQLKQYLAAYYEILESDSRPCLMQGLALVRNAFRADIFLLSFVETIGFQKLGLVQFLMAHASILIMRLRKKKIVFIYHNIRPHQGENYMSKSITRTLLKRSCLVISHSKDAANFAIGQLHFIGMSAEKVRFICHPACNMKLKPYIPAGKDGSEHYDVFIWGDVLPYKGIGEFVSDPSLKRTGIKVMIIGKCKIPYLEEVIEKSGVSYENRRPDFDEVAWYCTHSDYVLFPYLPGSISSSGLLINTVVLGGNPIGPAIGAFKDLAEEGVCLTYGNIQEMFCILADRDDRKTIGVDTRKDFIAAHSWEKFAEFLYNNI